MLDCNSQLNQFLRASLDSIVADIPQDRLGEPAPGNGHPPVWVLGHLAICAELGLGVFGVELSHPEWVETFGPGSSDHIESAQDYSMAAFMQVIREGYPRLVDAAKAADAELLNQPHGLGLLEGSAIETKGDLIAHLLTSHFAFHLAQLSHWRRAAGHGPLF